MIATAPLFDLRAYRVPNEDAERAWEVVEQEYRAALALRGLDEADDDDMIATLEWYRRVCAVGSRGAHGKRPPRRLCPTGQP